MKTILMCTVLIGGLFSQSISEGKAVPYLNMGQSAQQLALGNAGVAEFQNAASFYYNPSATLFKENTLIGINGQYLSLDRRLYSIGIHKNMKQRMQMSFGLLYATVNELYNWSSEGVRGEKAAFGSMTFFGSFGLKLFRKLGASLTVKYINESIETRAFTEDFFENGVAGDFSFLYPLNPKTHFGLQVRNFFGEMESNSNKIFENHLSEKQELSRAIVVGVNSQEFFEWIGVSHLRGLADLMFYEDDRKTFHLGLESNYFDHVLLRAGFDENRINAGLGIEFKIEQTAMVLDYAFVSSKYDEGPSHLISWKIGLN